MTREARTLRTDESEAPLRVRRFDTCVLDASKRALVTDEGWLRAPANITRHGVFIYANPANPSETWGELRPEEEVFSADSLASFELVPVVDNHPRGTGEVNASNARTLTVGAAGSVKRSDADPNYVSANLLVTAADAVRKVGSGKVELSCGYYCDRELAPPGSVAVDPISGKQTPYKYIQRNIRGNHIAIVDAARAGPNARIMLDRNDAIEFNADAATQEEEDTMKKKITIDGVTLEVDATFAELFERYESNNRNAIDKLTARADAAEASVKQITAQLAEAKDTKRFDEAVRARVEIESVAAKHDLKIDGLDNNAAKRALIGKLDASIKLDGKSEGYVDAMFDIVREKNPVQTQLEDAKRAASKTTPKLDNEDPEDKKKKANAGFFGHDAAKRNDRK